MTDAHEDRRRVLEALAILRGYTGDLSSGLPDGRRPDVARVNTRTRGLFVAEAKHAETGGDAASLVRLGGYLRWFAAHIQAGGHGVIGVCCDSVWHGNQWRRSVEALARDVGLGPVMFQIEAFGSETVLVWADVVPSRGGGLQWRAPIGSDSAVTFKARTRPSAVSSRT